MKGLAHCGDASENIRSLLRLTVIISAHAVIHMVRSGTKAHYISKGIQECDESSYRGRNSELSPYKRSFSRDTLERKHNATIRHYRQSGRKKSFLLDWYERKRLQ